MYCILIIDDLNENLSLLINSLKKEYKIKIANNSKTALTILNEYKPDLILLDIIMPGIDGYELCRIIKKNEKTKEIPIIFITSLNDIDNEKKGFEVGGIDYIKKPFNILIVKNRIKAHLALANKNKLLKIEISKKTKELNETKIEIIRKLSKAAEYKDKKTGNHIERVASYAKIIAQKKGMSKEEIEIIFNAAPLHDIGKIGIPDYILEKKDFLSNHEFEIIKTHTHIGANIIGETNINFLKIAKIIALEHHEKWDGSGYPYGLKKEEINIYARIISIVDVFDALTSKRSYKNKWGIKKTLKWIKNHSGTYFDPEIVNIFLDSIDEIIIEYHKLKD